MKYVMSLLLIGSSLCAIELVKEEQLDRLLFQKIKFEDHSYIHFQNRMNYGDCKIWHDPECETCNKNFGFTNASKED